MQLSEHFNRKLSKIAKQERQELLAGLKEELGIMDGQSEILF